MANKNLKNSKPAAAPEAPAPAPAVPAMSFDTWWAITSKKIPSEHKKEIVAADFRGRGLSNNEPVHVFNAALDKYGVNIK